MPVRLIARETIGSFLTRLAHANSLRIPHMLSLTAISSTRSFTPATDEPAGWSASTPERIAALAGRALPELAAAIPLLATRTPAATAPMHACRHCAAAKNITGMVIIRARPGDYLCTRHQQWLRGLRRLSLAALPELADSQRRHDRRTRNPGPRDRTRPPAGRGNYRPVAGSRMAPNAHQPLARAEPPTGRHDPRTRDLHADVVTHPEMLAVARLLILSQRARDVPPREIATRLGFPYPAAPTRSTRSGITCLSHAAEGPAAALALRDPP